MTDEQSSYDNGAKELRIRTPKIFDGNPNKVEEFLVDCQIYLICNQEIYDTNTKKICFVLSFMEKGVAADCKAMVLKDYREGTYPTYDQFEANLKESFLKDDIEGNAFTEMLQLSQTGKADEYISQFKILAKKAKITEDRMLIVYFARGLHKRIVKQIYNRDTVPTTIKDWYTFAAQYDNNYRRGRAFFNRCKRTFPQKNSEEKKTFSPKSTHVKYIPAKNPDAMDVDQLSTKQQKEYFAKGLCFNCGVQGHLSRECPKKKPKFQKNKPTPKNRAEAWTEIWSLIAALSEEEREDLFGIMKNEGL
ncbi:hypothetical protein V5O48_015062 [Marasmius crinis-equi]|uniref:CCHC-type domain-containing protein n=1 Tax=Marasmius crinis-equi TaxID=585013 RepID=A0ABR3EVI9_9AGAR